MEVEEGGGVIQRKGLWLCVCDWARAGGLGERGSRGSRGCGRLEGSSRRPAGGCVSEEGSAGGWWCSGRGSDGL